MKRWIPVAAIAALILLPAGFAAAQEEGRTYVRHDEDDWEDYGDRYALGLVFGLVNIDETALGDEDVEPYFGVSFRIPVGHKRKARTYSHEASRRFGLQGFIEPELGYWDFSEGSSSFEDLLLGVNFVGVTPIGPRADFFVGGGIGLHFYDESVPGVSDESGEALGANAHFGVDVHVGESVSLFAIGRFDIIDDRGIVLEDDLEEKAVVGLRFHF